MAVKVSRPKGSQRQTNSSPTGRKAQDGRIRAAKATSKKKK